MGCNGYVKTTVQAAESKRYTMELLASGDASEGICPRVEVHVDGKPGVRIESIDDLSNTRRRSEAAQARGFAWPKGAARPLQAAHNGG